LVQPEHVGKGTYSGAGVRRASRGSAMDYQGFISTVRQKAQLSEEEAHQVACATLRTLARRIAMGESEDLRERVPEQLRSCLEPDGPLEKLHLDGFLGRVAEESGVDPATAEPAVRAVFAALYSAVGPDEFTDLREELPKDFDAILDAAVAEAPPPEGSEPPFVGNLTVEEFLDRVAEEAGLDGDGARQAAEAVLEELGVRIVGGQVEDLLPYLPPELRPPLERGNARTGGRAEPLSLNTFLEDIKRREHVDRGAAMQHARAVLKALREAVGEKEFHDATTQLPGEFRILLRQG
jgi:uncharacterized protein (DUF2267 family)